MFGKVYGAAIYGVDSVPVTVEADVSDGLPSFDMVGVLSSEVKEARERVRTALKNSGFRIPPKRITINLSPADMRKSGAGFDFPIAAAVLGALGLVPNDLLVHCMFCGELGLDGRLYSVPGVLPAAFTARKKDCGGLLFRKEIWKRPSWWKEFRQRDCGHWKKRQTGCVIPGPWLELSDSMPAVNLKRNGTSAM